MKRLGRLSRSALVGAFATATFVAAPFAVASGHRQPPPRVLLAQAEEAAAPPSTEAPQATPSPTTPSPAAQAPAASAPVPVPAPAPEPAQAPTAAPAIAQPAAVAPAQGEPAATAQASAQSYSRAEIEKLVAPVALYPDPLLTQLLAATAYPLDVVQAARWLERNRSAVERRDFSGVDRQNWDESVKALARFPEVLRKLNSDIEWMSDLGEAFVNQPKDVAEAIQDLRQRAEAKGALKDTQHQRVARRQESGRDYVVIEPVEPTRIYVPVYDPWSLWWPEPGFVWGGGPWLTWPYYGLLVGVLPAAYYWGWNSGWIYPPFWPGYHGWRPGRRYAGEGPHRWTPNPHRFRPELVSRRSNEAIRRYGASSPGGRHLQQNLNAQQRSQRATRQLTRAGARTQHINRPPQNRRNAVRAQTNRGRNIAAHQRATRYQSTRVNRSSMQMQRSTRVQRGGTIRMSRQSMGARSFGGGGMRSFGGGGGGRSFSRGGGGGRGGGRGLR